jgi:hypothetical protein
MLSQVSLANALNLKIGDETSSGGDALYNGISAVKI